jgi:anti-sigma regulatory factor (Ser/Thr protein kinase)
LTALDRFAAQLPGAACASVFCGILDPGSGRLRYSSAGHPPPIVIHADGSTHLLDGGRTTLLAIDPGRARPEAEHTLPPRATLLLYTDGLVERRRQPLPDGIDGAAAVVRDGSGLPIEELASGIMERMAPGGGYEDDVALLLYRHPGPLELDLPAVATELARMRATLRGWLDRCGVAQDTAQGLLVAATEACANAVEHGYRNIAGGRILMRAAATAEELRLTVSDRGAWKAPDAAANPHRGRGIVLMQALAHHVTVTSGAAGTTVDIQVRIA